MIDYAYKGDWYCATCDANVGHIGLDGEFAPCKCGANRALYGGKPAAPGWPSCQWCPRAIDAGQMSDICNECAAHGPPTPEAWKAATAPGALFNTGPVPLTEKHANCIDGRAWLDLNSRHEAALDDLHATKRERDELLMENARMRRRIEAMERKR